jgi:hypothetical protein
MSQLPIEIHSYPNNSQITYKESGRTFHYTVIKEGFYPNKTFLKFTRKPNSFPLPDDYEVITVWGKQPNTVKCSIRYENSKPFFRVYYGDNFDQVLETTRSCTTVATQIQKASCLKFCNKIVYFYSINIFINIIYV